ncbi:hypothetical protein OF83DRAFT_121901 [Amylostereum chailletii]|nr:hypothetical protein OF83DRAFT_121901 [Amylostereum chailletii]
MVPITCNAVGDIMSLAEFAYNIVKALDESRGSTANYRELCDDFRSFSQVIECPAKAQENLPQSQDQVAYTKALEQGMGKFRRALGDVSEIVQQYEHTLGRGARGFRGIVAKLRWQFFTRSKIGPAKARIMECQSIITNIMVSNIIFKSSLPANVEDFSDSRDAIMLTDVLGDTLSIPWYQCQSWEMFHGILCVLFKGKAGKTYVQSRLYEIAQIVSMSKSLGITPEAWDVTVRRGMRVEMSVIVRRSEEEGQTGRTVRCLRCHKEMKQTRCRSRHYREEWMTW